MAFLIGLVSKEQEEELVAKGWKLENPNFSSYAPGMYNNKRMVQVYVDDDLFNLMDKTGLDKPVPPQPLYKSKFIIWSHDNPATLELPALARKVVNDEGAFLGPCEVKCVQEPKRDPDFPKE